MTAASSAAPISCQSGRNSVFAGAAEAVLRQFRRAKTDEAQQLFLLVRRRCAARLFKRLREADRGDVVARPRGPATGKIAIAVEMEIAAARDRIGPTSGDRRRPHRYRHRHRQRRLHPTPMTFGGA